MEIIPINLIIFKKHFQSKSEVPAVLGSLIVPLPATVLSMQNQLLLFLLLIFVIQKSYKIRILAISTGMGNNLCLGQDWAYFYVFKAPLIWSQL